jgi:hypothetical protein
MTTLKPFSVISKNRELNKAYKDLNSELQFYKKIDEKNKDAGEAADEKRILQEEKVELLANIEVMKHSRRKAKHTGHMLELEQAEVTSNMKLL